MKNETEHKIKEVQMALQLKHPNWPQDKARWIAMQALGVLEWRQ